MITDKNKHFLAEYGSSHVLDSLAHDENLNHSISGNHFASKEHLDNIIDDPSWEIRSRIAKNSPYKEHIDKLSKDHDEYVRRVVTRNKNVSQEHLQKLSNDIDKNVSYEARNQIKKRFTNASQ